MQQAQPQRPYCLQIRLGDREREAMRRLVYLEQKTLRELIGDFLAWKAQRYHEVADALAGEAGETQ